MDVELFLEGQAKWEEDSPHWLAMMYKMFRHAANEGQKEAECTVCQGHWGAFLSWTQRQTYLLSSLLVLKPPRKKSSPFTWKFTNNRGCQDPHLGNLS